MTLSPADIDRWNADTITTVFQVAIQRAHHIRTASAALGQTMGFLDWEGDTAAAARAATHRTMLDLDAHAEACAAVGRAAELAAAEVTAIKLRLRQIRDTAYEYRLSIDDGTGMVRLPASVASLPPAVQREIAGAQLRVWLAIRQLLSEAHRADQDLAAAIRGADDDLAPAKVNAEIAAGPFSVPVAPPPEATPKQVNAWWRSLNPSEQDQVKRSVPDALRNRDGIPADVRTELNTSALTDAITRMRNGWLDRDGWHTEPAKLADLIALRDTLAAQDNSEARLLLLDTTSDPDRVLAAVAVGDVDEAERIGVTVGGLNSRVSSSVEKMVGEARVQRAAASRLRSTAGLPNGAAVASVAYLGYGAPARARSSWMTS
jgi:hypothetical protein